MEICLLSRDINHSPGLQSGNDSHCLSAPCSTGEGPGCGGALDGGYG